MSETTIRRIQQGKIGKVLYADKVLLRKILHDSNTEKLPYTYFTFHNDDYEKKNITIIFQNHEPKKIYCTASEEDIVDAVKWVDQNNTDLKLVCTGTGYNNDDFIRNRVTAMLTPRKYLPKVKYTKHIVVGMDESLVQRCIICGEVVNDYRNAAWIGTDKPTGFEAGDVYVSDSNNPKIYLVELEEGEEFKNCQ